MSVDALFCTLTAAKIAELIRSAKRLVCYAAPGIQTEAALAMGEAAKLLDPAMFTVCLDFDERVMRMGYGDLAAVALLLEADIVVRSIPGMRTAMIIADDNGFIFTPTPLYLEAEPASNAAPNAMRMSSEQVAEALARISPTAKAIAIAQAATSQEKERIKALPVDVMSDQVTDIDLAEVAIRLDEAPPVRFDIARQVRVFEPYLQYVELNLSGAAIQRHRLAIPPNIQKLGGSEDLEGRLRTTFDLIKKGGKLSSKPLEDALNEIRKNFTPSLGKDHGRVVLKAAKPHLLKRLEQFRKKLESHQDAIGAELQKHLDESREQIVAYYLNRVIESPPDALLGKLLSNKPTEEDARRWLNYELDRVFPNAASLIDEMKIEECYKDVTFETLNREDFIGSVNTAFPDVNWDKAYEEFKAAGESEDKGKKK
jgi:hypothetical protein